MDAEKLEAIRDQLFNGINQISGFLEQASKDNSGLYMAVKLTKEYLPEHQVEEIKNLAARLAEGCYQAKVTANMVENLLDEVVKKDV